MICPHKLLLDYIIRMQFCGNIHWNKFSFSEMHIPGFFLFKNGPLGCDFVCKENWSGQFWVSCCCF